MLDKLNNIDLNNIDGMKKPNNNFNIPKAEMKPNNKMFIPTNVGQPPAKKADTENSKYFDL